MEQIQMSSPYTVAPPQGNLIGSIMDFIGQSRALQLDAGTRNQINQGTGFGPNVDPFQVQKYQGEGQRQQVIGDTNRRANTEQQWQGDDRTSQANVMGGLAQNPVIAQDPVLGALVGGGSNAMIGEAVMRMLGNDRSSKQQFDNSAGLYGAQHAYNTARDFQQNEYNKQQTRGGATGRMSAQEQALQAIRDAVQHKAATDSAGWPGGDRSKLQELELAGVLQSGRDPATVMAEMEGDRAWNAPGGGRDKAALQDQNRAEVKAIADQKAGNKADPRKVTGDIGDPRTANISKYLMDFLKAYTPQSY
jgi:hypothetical protein